MESIVDLSTVVTDKAEEDMWRANLAVGGMTCSTCSGAISDELKTKSWVRDVSVNLIANRAAIVFIGRENAVKIVDAIGAIGYEAILDSVEKFSRVSEAMPGTDSLRIVGIRVDGIFCHHCPPHVLDSLKIFGDRITVEKPLTIQDPILRISYTPETPTFTIRHILSAISGVESLQASIYHPPTLEERSHAMHTHERKQIFIRVMFTLIVAIPTLIIGIVFMSLVPMHNSSRHFLMQPLVVGVSRAQWALLIMATPVYLFCADVFHVRAFKEVRSMWRRGSNTSILRRFYRFGSMNMLMSLGTSIAYISSVAQLIVAGVNRPALVEDSSFYFDSVVFLTLFLLVGRFIEAYSKSKTGDAVLMLAKLRPAEALLVEEDASSISVKVDVLEFGDIVRVLCGGSPPCDGTIIQGETRFDESSLTGESKLVKKTINDEVYTGTINKGSPISIKVTGVAGSSMLDQIVKAVREGQTRRAPIERIADGLTGYFVPFVTLAAILTWAVWLGLGYSGNLPISYLGHHSTGWLAWSLQFAIAVFVVACPCGLALAAPTALFVGGGLAAQNGILAKGGGEAFELASRLDCVVFDKTGTLTMGGEPVVTDFQLQPIDDESTSFGVANESTVLRMIQALEENSSHTVAKALTSFCRSRDVGKGLAFGAVEEVAGQGVRGELQLRNELVSLIIGNEYMLSVRNVGISKELASTLQNWKSEGKSVALAAINFQHNTAWKLVAVFAISDPVRPEAISVINALHKRGTDVWMLSGDNQTTANAIGAKIGILSSNIIAGVHPNQKAEKIQYLQKSLKSCKNGVEHRSKRALVAMVGDGINDSPALTAADVGIAIGSGSDIAISSAEFVLVSSNLEALITLLDLSKVVFRRIKFNFAWAMVYNMIALPVAAGVLYPVGGRQIRLDPVWASLAMALSSISVVCSSLLLRSRLPWVGWRRKTE